MSNTATKLSHAFTIEQTKATPRDPDGISKLRCYGIEALYDFIDTTRPDPSAESSSVDSAQSFGGMPLNNALSLAQKGGHWQAGADDLQQVQLPSTHHHAPHTKRKRAMGPAGAAPCVPTFLSNNPANMRYTHKQPQKRKFLKVNIHVGRNGNAQQHHALNRGKAIMAALTELQTQGYALEVWAVWRNADCDTPQHPAPQPFTSTPLSNPPPHHGIPPL